MMLSIMMNPDNSWQERQARCPSCDQRVVFSFAGEQHWPVKVAEAIGMEPVMRLWHCHGCQSTISECDLQ